MSVLLTWVRDLLEHPSLAHRVHPKGGNVSRSEVARRRAANRRARASRKRNRGER